VVQHDADSTGRLDRLGQDIGDTAPRPDRVHVGCEKMDAARGLRDGHQIGKRRGEDDIDVVTLGRLVGRPGQIDHILTDEVGLGTDFEKRRAQGKGLEHSGVTSGSMTHVFYQHK